MEMKENNQKKMLLSVLGVAILVVAVVGISFAAFSTTFDSNVNSVTTGTIMVSYSEPSQAINVTDAMPISDENGVAQNDTFDFTVSAKADNALTVPYEISLTKVEGTACTGNNTPEGCYTSMADNQVKVYLEKGTTAVSETTATGKLVSGLTTSTLHSSAKVLHSDSFTLTGSEASAASQSYTLRMWIDHSVEYSAVSGKEYHAKVNVESRVTPIAS